MARVIGFNPVPQTDFNNGNSLLQLAELQRQNTLKSAEDTLNHFSKAVKDKNTALVQNFINQFKPEELNTDTTKQSINNYINQMNKDTGNMVDNTIYKYLDDRKDTLNKRIGDEITNTNNTAIASMNNIKAKENQENYDSNLLGSLSYIANNSTNQDEADSAKSAYEQNVANANANVRVGALLSSMGYDTKYNQALANQINSVKPMVENQLTYNFDQSLRFKDILNNPNSTPEAKAEAKQKLNIIDADIRRVLSEYKVHPEVVSGIFNTVSKAYESYKDKREQQVFLNGLEKQKVDITQQNADTNEMKTSIDMVKQQNDKHSNKFLDEFIGKTLWVNSDGSLNGGKINEAIQGKLNIIDKQSNIQDINNADYQKILKENEKRWQESYEDWHMWLGYKDWADVKNAVNSYSYGNKPVPNDLKVRMLEEVSTKQTNRKTSLNNLLDSIAGTYYNDLEYFKDNQKKQVYNNVITELGKVGYDNTTVGKALGITYNNPYIDLFGLPKDLPNIPTVGSIMKDLNNKGKYSFMRPD